MLQFVSTYLGLLWVDPALDGVSGRRPLDAVPGRDLEPRSLCCDPVIGLEVKSLRYVAQSGVQMQTKK